MSIRDLSILLIKQSLNISVAESCTGGRLSALLTSISGSSTYFDRGYITYSNQAKIDMLDVDDKAIQPVRYRAIIKTQDPLEIIKTLDSAGVKAIVPTEDWEILGPKSQFPNSFKLSKETVSIPLYPSLTNSEINVILSALVKK